MLKKKKISTKQNPSFKKKINPINTKHYNTQENRFATIESMDMKQFNKTMDIKKSGVNQTKKSISRKSTNQSIKPNLVLQSPNFNRMLRQFKDLKLIHQNSSKSPVSAKSKSANKNKSKKLSYQTLRSNATTMKNQSLKLERTLKKLNINDLLKDQQSEMPIVSSSSVSIKHVPYNYSVDNDDEGLINLREMRDFCSTASQPSHPVHSIKYSNLIIENQAATKIQRAWKRFRTKKLIERYVFIIKSRLSQRIQKDVSQHSFFSDEMNIFSSGLYKKNEDLPQPQQIIQNNECQNNESNHKQQYQQSIEILKQEQLNKWNEIISIIKQTDCNNPRDIEQLFATITKKSEINKRKLLSVHLQNHQGQEHRSQQAQRDEEIKQKEKQLKKIEQQRRKDMGLNMKNYFAQQSRSQNSIEQAQEYNCRKYVNYLDCDVFNYDKNNLSGSSQKRLEQALKKSTISKKKQEVLLNQLRLSNLPNRLGENKLYSSNSLVNLKYQSQSSSKLGHQHKGSNFSQTRMNLARVNSQKYMRVSLQIKPQPIQQINLQALTKQFLQQGNPICPKEYERNEQGRHLATDQSNQNQSQIQDVQFLQQIQKRQANEQQQSKGKAFQRSKPSFQLYSQLQQQQQLTFFKIHSVPNQQSHQSQEQANDQANQGIEQENVQNQAFNHETKIQEVSILLFNSLILQTLKDIAKSDMLASSFRNYSKSTKPKIKRCENGVRKKGFPTDKKQIQSFLQSIISYLKAYQQKIFKNLEIPTGPSALQMLRYMHESANDQSINVCEDEEDGDEANIMVIPNRIFDIFWQLKEKSIVVQVPANFDDSNSILFKQNLDYLKSFNKIFYRSLFDALNECLDYSRNFGQYGKPFPWKKAPLFAHNLSQRQIQSQIVAARKKMMELATTYCGLIIQKEQMGDLGGNEEYIGQVQEDRLSRMLANDLIDCENKWVFYDDEEAEVLIQLAECVYSQIFLQLMGDIYRFL